MIQVGINENVILKSVSLNDKNTLSFSFEQFDPNKADKPSNPFDMINSDEVVEVDNGTTINIFQPNVPDKADMTEEKKIDMVTNDVNKTKAIMFHFLKGWMTSDQVKGAIKPFDGIPIDANNYAVQILKKDILAAIHLNMAKTFIQLITPFLAEQKLFRLLLVRQSADKHWPSFRGRYIDENPFWESMEIPKEASKLKFTSYEISQKLNDSTPSPTKEKADKKEESAPTTAANIFGT